MSTQATSPPNPSSNHLPAAVTAALASGAVGGGLIGTLFGAASVLEAGWNGFGDLVGYIMVVVFAAAFCAVLGAVVALLPGGAVAAALQSRLATSKAPAVGAALGLVLGVLAYFVVTLGDLSQADELIGAYVGFGLSGTIGGASGGLLLKRLS